MSSSTGKDQEQEELAAFYAFAAVCQLPLLPDTAISQKPPRPDISCTLEDGSKLGFELVQCEDVTSAGTKQNKVVAVTEVGNRERDLTFALQGAYSAALAAGQFIQPERFEYHAINVHFVDGASFVRCRNAIPKVIKILNERGPGVHVVETNSIRLIECRPWDTKPSSYKGPMFSCNGVGIHVGLSVIERIKTKLGKTYQSDTPIHLLAWSYTVSAVELKINGYDEELAEFLATGGLGPFQRVWVFGRNENEIAFDSERPR